MKVIFGLEMQTRNLKVHFKTSHLILKSRRNFKIPVGCCRSMFYYCSAPALNLALYLLWDVKNWMYFSVDFEGIESYFMGLFCRKKGLKFYGHNSTKIAMVFTYTHSYMPTCLRQLLLLPS